MGEARSKVEQHMRGGLGPWATPRSPGAVYALLRDREVVELVCLGEATVGGASPTERTSFRIASMTKSFTAAAILQLRDRGKITLDTPIAAIVPECAGWSGRTHPPPTVRSLMSMSSGLAEDDPIADRLQSLSDAGLDEMLRAEPAWATPVGQFEYSNLGYAALGRAITNIADEPFDGYISTNILQPLGLSNTTWKRPDQGVALGYVWRDGWLEEPMDDFGAFASMGGLFSTLDDVVAWVRFLAGWFDSTDDVLSLRSRRELAIPHTPHRSLSRSGWPPQATDVSLGYGFGLNTAHSSRHGQVVWHTGGYPGFGSVMAWAPTSGEGCVILTNGRYGVTGQEALGILAMTQTSTRSHQEAVRPNPALLELQERMAALAEECPDEPPSGVFAMNVELDEPWAERVVRLREALHAVGAGASPGSVECHTALRATWSVDGIRGRAEYTIMLTPTAPLRVMLLSVDFAVHPNADLRRSIARVLDEWRATTRSADWASALPAKDAADGDLGVPVAMAGDGVSWCRWRVSTRVRVWTVAIALGEDRRIQSLEIRSA